MSHLHRLALRSVSSQFKIQASKFQRRFVTQAHAMATKEQLKALQNYTACDISDALLKLKVPNCGLLPDLSLCTPPSASLSRQVLIAPASTVLFAPKASTDLSGYPESNIPAGKHYVDLTAPDTIVVISQPQGQICAVLGGIMALRMKVLKAKGVVVHGRVRDVEELAATGLPVSRVSVTPAFNIAQYVRRYGREESPSLEQGLKPSRTPYKFP